MGVILALSRIIPIKKVVIRLGRFSKDEVPDKTGQEMTVGTRHRVVLLKLSFCHRKEGSKDFARLYIDGLICVDQNLMLVRPPIRKSRSLLLRISYRFIRCSGTHSSGPDSVCTIRRSLTAFRKGSGVPHLAAFFGLRILLTLSGAPISASNFRR